MTPYETQLKLNSYKFYPKAFSIDEAKEIKQYADMYGIPTGEQSAIVESKSNIFQQFSSGFTEGVLGPLAFGGWAEEPENEFQSIAHSAGHLLGFALPMAGSLVSFGGTGVARLGLMGTGKVAQAVGKAGMKVKGVGDAMKGAKSVPMYVADKAQDATQSILAKAGFEASKYLTKGQAISTKAKLVNTAFQAQHLAVASTVSGIWNGKDDELDNLMFGAVAGGFFGGLGNFVKIGELVRHPNPKVSNVGKRTLYEHSKQFANTLYTNRGPIIKGAIGAGFQGGMASMQGAPTATQLYEYALGAFFGSRAHGVAEGEANKFFQKFNTKETKFSDMRNMLQDKEFSNLPQDSQDIVKASYQNHIGDIWDRISNKEVDPNDPTSIPAVAIAGRIKDSYNKALERYAKKIEKQVENLEPHEIAEVRAELIDTVPTAYRKQVETGIVTQGIYKKLIDPEAKIEGDTKKIIDSMTPKQIEEVKSGVVDPLEKAIKDYFEKLPEESIQTTAKDILKSEERAMTDQAESTVDPPIRRFVTEIGRQVQKTEHGLDPNAVLKDVVEFFNTIKSSEMKGKSESELTDLYTERIQNKYPQIELTDKIRNGIQQTFMYMKQGELRPIISYDGIGKAVEKITGMNVAGKKVTSNQPKSADEKWYQGEWGKEVKILEFSEVVVRDSDGVKIFSPYEMKRVTEIDPISGKRKTMTKPTMDRMDWLEIQRQLNKDGDYLKIPKKDGGVERVYKYHKDTMNKTTEDILGEIVKNAGDKNITRDVLQKYLDKDLEVYLESMGWGISDLAKFPELKTMHEKAFRSNYLYEKNWDFKSAIARVKREALLSSKSFYQLDKLAFDDLTGGTGKIKIIAIEAEKNLLANAKKKIKQWFNVEGKEPETFFTLDKNGKVVEQAWESKIDGWLVPHSDLYKRIMRKMGFRGTEMSHMKPAVAVRMPDGSLFLIKGGVHPSRKAYDDAMGDKNSMIVVTSAIKSLPKGAKVYRGQAKKDGRYDIEGFKGKASLEIDIEDFRINPGVYGNEHSGEPTTIKKQMHTFFDGIVSSPEGYRGFMDSIHKDAVEGSREAVEYFEALKENPDALPPKNFDVKRINDTQFVEVINNPNHKLHKDLNLEIFKKLKRMASEEEFEASETFRDLKEYANNFEQWYRSTGYNPVSMIINQSLYEKSVHIYRMNKFTNPEWRRSGSSWVAGVDPVMEAKTGGIRGKETYKFLQDGAMTDKKVSHFKLGHSHSKMEIDWIGGKSEELGKAWMAYKEAIGKNRNKMTDENIADMRQKLLFAVMRVPANAISGTRALMFDGFVENDVSMADWGTYMKGRDHFYIDGADVDGDKVFFFQGMNHHYLNDLIKHDSFLERPHKKSPNGKVFFENKSKKYDELFKSTMPEDGSAVSPYKGLVEIWSGYQDGADIAGVKAGEELGIKTRGFMPKGFRTESGNKPEYRQRGAIETPEKGYKQRTLNNLRNSDATVIFADNVQSAGTQLTINGLESAKKPYIINPSVEMLNNFLSVHKVRSLNVAGNRAQNEATVKRIIMDAVNGKAKGLSTADYVNNNPLAQWSPGALRKAGMSAYTGKKGLGQVVNAKQFLNPIIADVINNKKGKLNILITGKNGKPYARLVGKTDKKHLESEFGYNVIGTEAHSRTADSANYYTMATPEEMVNIVFRSAFKDLEVVNLDADNMNTYSPTLSMLRYSKEYGHLYELNQKIYGYNHAKNRAYSIEEIQDATRSFKGEQTMTSSIVDIAHKIAQNEMEIDPLRHFNYTNFRESIRNLSEQVINDPNVLKYITRQNLRVMPLYYSIDYNAVYKAMGKFDFRTLDPSTGKEGGRLKVLSENATKEEKKPYRDLLWEAMQPPVNGRTPLENRLGKKGSQIQKTFNRIFSNTPMMEDGGAVLPIQRYSKRIEKEYRINDSYDVWSALQLMSKGRRLEQAMMNAGHDVDIKRGNIPSEDIIRIANKKVNGEKTDTQIDRLLEQKFMVEIESAMADIQAGKTPRIRNENKFIVLRDIITRHAEAVKIGFRSDMKHMPTFRTEAEAERFINKDVTEISKYAKELGIKPEVAVDYYYNYLLGSLRPQQVRLDGWLKHMDNRIATAKKNNKKELVKDLLSVKEDYRVNYESTSTPRFIWSMDAIPDAVKAEFMKGYADTFDLLNTVEPLKIQDSLTDYLAKGKEEIKIGKVESKPDAVEVNKVEIDRLFKAVDIGGVELAKGKYDRRLKAFKDMPGDIPQVLNELSKSFDQLPDGALLRFEDIYTYMKVEQGSGKTSIKEATWDDVRAFNNYIKEIVNGTAKDNKVKKLFHFLFPDTVGARMAGHDMDLIYKMNVPVRNAKDMGMATIKVPVSTMNFIHKAGGMSREIEDSIKNSMVENLFESIGVKGELEALDNGIKSFTDLFMLAQKKMNFERTQHKDRKNFYQQEMANSQDLMDAYANKKFKINRNGKIVERTGEQLINDIIEQQSRYMSDFYESYLGAGTIENGAWNRIDWKRVDKNYEWQDNGLKLHDMIRYDKYGRFDMQNFQHKVMDYVETFGVNKLYNLIGKRDNPLSVELLNRVQYEIALEEGILRGDVNPTSDIAMQQRVKWRENNEFFGIGRVGGRDSGQEFITEYFPQMMHDRKKLDPWIKDQQQNLKNSLENYVTDLLKEGKRVNEKPYNINPRYQLRADEIKDLTQGIEKELSFKKYGVYPSKKNLRNRIIELKMEMQRGDFEGFLATRVESATGQSDYVANFLYAQFEKNNREWKDIGADHRPGTGKMRSEVPMPYFSYGYEVLEAYTNQWVGSFFKNLNALAFRKKIQNYEKNNQFVKDNPEMGEMWSLEMKKFASSLLGKSMVLPTKYSGLTIAERAMLKQKIKTSSGIVRNRLEDQLKQDDDLKEKYNISQSKWNPLKNIEYRMSDQNMIQYMEAKSMRLNNWLIPGLSKKLHGTKDNPVLFGRELPTSPQARNQVLAQILNNVGAFESKMSLVSLLAHPKTYLGNIMGGSQNTITLNGLRNFRRARDVQWLVQNVFKGATLKDGTPISDKNTIHRWVAEIGALESFYINEAMMNRNIDSKKLMPFIKEVIARDPSDVAIKDLMKKYQVTDSFLSLGGSFMRKSERTLRSDAFISQYLNSREVLSRIIPDMPFDHPYLTAMALKGVEATQFLYHNVNRPSVSRSSMGKVFTRFQPFMWNSIRFRRDIYKQAKRYGFRDKQSMDRLKRLATFDLATMALAQIFVGSIFDSILPPPMSYMQDTADWLFGDQEARERAFFSAYPSPIMAPLQAVTAPVNRYWMPLMSATINGEWDRWAQYYVHTLYPFGRLARSTVMTLEKPEMFAEFMFGIPIHKIGSMIRKKNEEEDE